MLGVIMLLSMVFDLSDRLGEFLENEAPVTGIIFIYYVNFILKYGSSFSFMIIFISVIWFTAKMAQETEIIPILNSGKPFSRFVRPYLIGATILVIISLFINHYILPVSNKKSLAFENKYYRDALNVSNYFADFPNHQTVQFDTYSSTENIVHKFVLERFSKKGDLEYILIARTAQNQKGTKNWKLTDYFERYVGNPHDKLIEGRSKDTIFPFELSQMAKRENVSSAMKTSELREFIHQEKMRGSSRIPLYELELHHRTSNPFATYILTIIGIAVSSQKKRGGIGVNIALGLSIVLIYVFAMKIMAVAAENVGFPALIASWIPNFVFGIVAIFMYRFAQK